MIKQRLQTPTSDSAFISEGQNTTSTKVNITVFLQKTQENLLHQQHPENMLPWKSVLSDLCFRLLQNVPPEAKQAATSDFRSCICNNSPQMRYTMMHSPPPLPKEYNNDRCILVLLILRTWKQFNIIDTSWKKIHKQSFAKNIKVYFCLSQSWLWYIYDQKPVCSLIKIFYL